jgi:hypothetical protein
MDGTETAWHGQVMARANASEAFAVAARWLDTKIVLRFGADAHWLKIYRGRVIDAMPYDPSTNMLGYDVVVDAARETWESVVAGTASFGRASATGQVHEDGDRVEVERSYKAVQILGGQVIPAVGLPTGGRP